MATATLQAELISDDPRREAESTGAVEDLRSFIRSFREMGGLLTTGQAAAVLKVPPSSVRTWVLRGRLKSVRILDVVMVSAPEVLALHRQRISEPLPTGGRGNKAATIPDMAKEAWEDIFVFAE
jgi:hypothetical protein